MINRILINREECEVRVAFMEQQTLVELHTEKVDEQTIVNNIYRGRVQDVVPGLQAAFIDVGLGRNMFLHFMDIRPESLVLSADDQREAMADAVEKGIPGRIERKGRRPRPDPSGNAPPPVRKGDEIIVQVVKDEIGTKAPRVTTNLALAGRYLVMLPFPSQEGGVSRKISTGADRSRLKKLLAELKAEDHSFIIRTAGVDQPEEPVVKDAEALISQWHLILKSYKKAGGPGLLYNDHNLLSRLVRDAFPADFEEVICDNQTDAMSVEHELQAHMPHSLGVVKTYQGVDNLFDAFGVEKQIEKAMAHKFWLKSGGYLIIDENEALTAIDINTGRFVGKKDQEKTSLKTNLEACEAIAQMIRLRDIGGIIVIDFIDMLSRQHQEKLHEELRHHLKKDRAKLALGKIGDFGLMMLTRKRQRMSLHKQMHDECPYCQGTGYVLKPDEVYRRIKYDIRKLLAEDGAVAAMMVSAHSWTVDFLRTRYRAFLADLKNVHGVEISLREDPTFHLEDYQITPMRRKAEQPVLLPSRRIDESERMLAPSEVPVDFHGELVELPATAFREVPTEEPPVTSFEEEFAAEDYYDEEADERFGMEMSSAEEDDDDDEEAPKPAPMARPVAPPPVPAEGEGRRRRRRRRESSSERRARRRRMQEAAEAGIAPAPEDVAAAAEEAEEATEAAATAVAPTTPAVVVRPVAPVPAPAAPEPPRSGLAAAVELEQDRDEEDREQRRTRRGSRGGRRRRGDEPAAAAPQAVAPTAPAAAPASVPVAEQSMRLAVRKSAKDALLAGLLDEIDMTAAAPQPAAPPAPVVAPPAPAKPKPSIASLLSDLMDDLSKPQAAAPQQEPAAPAQPKATGRVGKKATPAKAAAKAVPAEKPAKAPAKGKPAAAPKATKQAAPEKPTKAAPKPKPAPKAKAAAEPKAPAPVAKPARAAKPAPAKKKKAAE